MAKKRKAKLVDSLVGRWVACDDWATMIAFVISKRNGSFRVRAIDQSDGEEAEIYGVKSTNEALTFGAYWSSGQFTKYRLRPMELDQMEVVYTYTATQTFKQESAQAVKRKRAIEKSRLEQEA